MHQPPARKVTRTALLLRYASLALAFLPAIVPLDMIFRYGVDMPYMDQWDPDIAGVLIKARAHTLNLIDLVALHSEHRLVMPRIAWVMLDSLTNWNCIAEMILGWVIACGSSAGILWLICRTQSHFDKSSRSIFAPRPILDSRVIFLWLLSNLLIFAPSQWENWLCGISAAGFMSPFFLILSLVAATSSLKPWPKFVLVILFSIAATYSSANGMLAWPLCAPLLAFPFSKQVFREQKVTLATWLAAALLFVGLYFVGYRKPLHGGAHPYANGIWPIAEYVPAFVGAPFSDTTRLDAAKLAGDWMLAMYAGAFIYFAYRFQNKEGQETCRRGLLWLMVGGFVIASGVEAGIGRGALTPRQALSSRYISFSLYMPIAVAVMTCLIADDLRQRLPPRLKHWVDSLPMALAFLVMTVDLLGFPAARDFARTILLNRQQAKGGLLLMNDLPIDPVLTKVVFSDIRTQARYPAILSQMGYLHPPLIASRCAADFQETDADKVNGAAGKIEDVAQSGPKQWLASGWAVSKKKSFPADAVFITYDDEKSRPTVLMLARFTYARPDVNNMLDGDFGPCGWMAEFSNSNLPADMTATSIRAWALNVSTGKAFELDGAIRLNLAPTTAR